MQKQFIAWALLYTAGAVLAAALFLFEHGFPLGIGINDGASLLLIFLHISAGVYFFIRASKNPDVRPSVAMAERLAYRLGQNSRRSEAQDHMLLPDILFAISLIIFLFYYIFALAANMDYVQRFIEDGGRLLLAIDTKTERLFVFLRYGLYLLLYPVVAAVPVFLREGGTLRRSLLVLKPAVLLTVSVLLYSFSFPSDVFPNGMGFFAWFSIAPLIILLNESPGFRRWMFYGTTWTLVTVMIRNYWLGTFSMISLQAAVIILGSYGVLFFAIYWAFYQLQDRLFLSIQVKPVTKLVIRVLLFASLWTLYDWVFTFGFTAYPWTIMPHTQWRNLPLLQITPFSGMWGISFLIYIVNFILAFWISADSKSRALGQRAVLVALIGLSGVHVIGSFILLQHSDSPVVEVARVLHSETSSEHIQSQSVDPKPASAVRVSLIQQNSDPRKHEYHQVLETLMTLTHDIDAVAPDIDLNVWSETAFVPNISRWGAAGQDPNHPLVQVVRRMLAFQSGTDTWLLTGNDDYDVEFDEDGNEISRDDYNAAVLINPEGETDAVYHKIHLVPFTEHFPYTRMFPGLYALLLDYDIHFWEAGTERTVFEHPKFRFSTPICFEDAFPNDVRKFVNDGAQVIVNISNDYWSLTEVAAKQHFSAALFRATENRRILLRATASGMTAAVDPWGRVISELPSYREGALAVDIQPLQLERKTLYSSWGDWFIYLLSAAVLLLAICSVWILYRGKRSVKKR